MARTQATSTLSPVGLALGQRVIYEHALEVIQQQNHTYGNRPQSHLALTTGPAAWSTNTVHTLRTSFENSVTGTRRTEIDTYVYVDPDVANLTIGVRTEFLAADTGEVRVIIGGDQVDFVCTNAENGGEQTDNLTTLGMGTGWLAVTVQLLRTAGSSIAYLRNIRIQDAAITGSLPGPVND